MVGVIGMWVWSAMPMLSSFGKWLGIGKGADVVEYSPTETARPEYGFPVSIPTMGDVVKVQETEEKKPTYTPYPTYTAYPTYTPYPEKTKTPEYVIQGLGVSDPGVTAWEPVKLKLSYYWPALCEGIDYSHPNAINCDWIDVQGTKVPEISQMASGEAWAPLIGKVIACPMEWSLGSLVKIEDRVFRCADRGGAIVRDGDYYWIDLLYPRMPDGWYYGRIVEGWVWSPSE